MKKKVVVAGHLCIDITPAIPEDRGHDAQSFLAPGRMINVGRADIHTGGAVANTGLAMKFFNANVSLAGAVGNDELGALVADIIKSHGIKEGLICKENESTSYSVILAIPGVDRIILHHSGVNDTFCADDLPEETLRDAALMHFGYPPAMRMMFEAGGDELERIMRKARGCGAATSLDMSGIDVDSDAGKANWERILQKTLPHVDVFVPSAEELCYMLNRERFDEITELASGRDFCERLDIDRDVRPLAERCIAYGAKIVLIKCGAPGMYFQTARRDAMQKISPRVALNVDAWSNRSGFERSYVPDYILSGTGAGDTSIAAFLTAMLDGYSPERSVQLAAGTGASCVAAYDALSSLRTFAELEQKIDSGWEKVKRFE